MTYDWTHVLYALFAGVIPALVWLLFWIREDNLHPEPRSKIFQCFLAGMIAVLLVLPLQLFVQKFTPNLSMQYFAWAAMEEIIKFIVAYIVAVRSKIMDEPIDALIYMITVALGFAALENAFFIMGPLSKGAIAQSIVTGDMRFIGATLLHVISSASIGIGIAHAFYKRTFIKFVYCLIGIFTAIALHTAFNLFIIKATAFDTLKIFGVVWVGAVILMVMFEEVKEIRPSIRTI